MKIKLAAEVTDLRKHHKYQPYPLPEKEYTASTLTILKNERGISGTITVEEELPFGGLFTVGIDTDTNRRVTEDATASDFATHENGGDSQTV
jgi:hypothetical protein